MEVTVPHGLFIQACYWSNEFLFWEARPLCLRVSLVEQAVISFGFPLLLWGRACHPWWNAVARKSLCRHWVEARSDVFGAARWMLSPQWHKWSWLHEVMDLLQMRTEAQISHSLLCVQKGSKGKSGFKGVCSPLILGRGRGYFLSILVKGGMTPLFQLKERECSSWSWFLCCIGVHTQAQSHAWTQQTADVLMCSRQV